MNEPIKKQRNGKYQPFSVKSRVASKLRFFFTSFEIYFRIGAEIYFRIADRRSTFFNCRQRCDEPLNNEFQVKRRIVIDY